MVGGLAGDFGPRGEAMIVFQRTAVIDAVERTHGEHGGKGSPPLAGGLESSRLQHAAAERSPNVIVIAGNDHSGVVTHMPQRLASQHAAQLDGSFKTGK